MISANGGLPAHRYTPQVTQRWPRGSEPASPHRTRRCPCACAPRSLACATRSPPARQPTPLCGALRATSDRRPVRPHRPTIATGPAPAWRRLCLGRPPIPMRPAQASTLPPAVPRGLPHTGHRDRHQGTTTGPNTTRHQPYIRYCALVLPPLCPASPPTNARARAPPGTRRPHHNTCRGDYAPTESNSRASPRPG